MVWAHIITPIQQIIFDCTLPFLRLTGAFGVSYGANVFGEVTYQINKPPAVNAAEQDYVSINGHSPPTYSTNPLFWAHSLPVGDRNYYVDPASGTTYVPGWVQDYALCGDPTDTATTDYGVFAGVAHTDGSISRGCVVPFQARTRDDDATALTYNNTNNGPDPGGYYGGIVSAAPDAATPTGLYVVVTSRKLGGNQHLWNLVGHEVSGGLVVGTQYYYEWTRVSAANLSDPYHPSSALRANWTYLHSDPAHPDQAVWAPHGIRSEGSMNYTYASEIPFLTFGGGPHTIFRQGGAYYALAQGSYYVYADQPTNTYHAVSQVLGVWKATGDPILPASWTLYKVLSPYNLLVGYGSADFNRDYGQSYCPDDIHHARIGNQIESFGGDVYFTMPLGLADSAGWVPPTRTVIWKMDSAGTITASFDLPLPGVGNYIYFGSMQQLDGNLYMWTYEATDTTDPATLKVFTLYRKDTGGWVVASRSTRNLVADDYPGRAVGNNQTAVYDCIPVASGDEIDWLLMAPSNGTEVLRWKASIDTWKVCSLPQDQHHFIPRASRLYYVGNPPA